MACVAAGYKRTCFFMLVLEAVREAPGLTRVDPGAWVEEGVRG